MTDGIALMSVSHPMSYGPGLLACICDLSEDALETIEIEMPFRSGYLAWDRQMREVWP